MPMTLPTAREHRALGRVQRGKQGRGSMTPIIVGHTLDVAQHDGQHGLGAFQRLNLALLVHTQHHRVLRWMLVQSHDFAHCLHANSDSREIEVTIMVRLYPQSTSYA